MEGEGKGGWGGGGEGECSVGGWKQCLFSTLISSLNWIKRSIMDGAWGWGWGVGGGGGAGRGNVLCGNGNMFVFQY